MSTTELIRDDQPPHGRQAPNAFVRLYRGETTFDFVGRRRWWYLLSAIIIVAGLVSFGVKGFNWGIDFKGGTSWEVPAHGATVSQVQTAVANRRGPRSRPSRAWARGPRPPSRSRPT